VDQKLLPKDCLPAAAAAQRSRRSAETLSLKHLPAAPGRPNPATVLHAFGMMEQDLAAQPELIDVERIKACIERAAAWMSSQERLYIDIAA
jgi:hypothetical protein